MLLMYRTESEGFVRSVFALLFTWLLRTFLTGVTAFVAEMKHSEQQSRRIDFFDIFLFLF
ncbi:hypothetical protein HMPREF1554_01228 [Porphyromonas gingivalis F0569]|nr:hypothetical protein HMPREF1554_01228 [Porphyromonas gingivalis F0569]ERJ86949.1 hypothetical protein HMPREF1989_00905 [Porphyromonas gingivalis F0566]